MKNHIDPVNNIFWCTMAGVLLFIASMGFSVAILANINKSGMSYSLAGILATSSLYMLVKAVRQDRKRTGRFNEIER
jgi:uncharacterized membrane protein